MFVVTGHPGYISGVPKRTYLDLAVEVVAQSSHSCHSYLQLHIVYYYIDIDISQPSSV